MRPVLFAQTYGVALLAFLLLDFTWLGYMARGFYRRQLGHLLSPDVRWLPAIIFYLIFVGAIMLFAVLPAVERGSLARAALLGGFFGFAAYATYDLTNLATLKGFPAQVVFVDMAWGTVLSATVAIAGFVFATRV